jgi:glycosyltransferase involved in cell wall biosynthesis
VNRRRVLVLVPFPPRRDGSHGGARATGGLLAALGEQERLAVAYLRRPDEAPLDDAVRARSEHVVELPLPRDVGSRLRRAAGGYLAGRPSWAAECFSPDIAARVRELADSWAPDIAQFEFLVTLQYAPALGASAAARVLVEHDPAARTAPGTNLATRLLARADRTVWPRHLRSLEGAAHAVVVFSEGDRDLVAAADGRRPVVVIPPGVELPTAGARSHAALEPTVLFVGSFRHPPNVEAARRLVDRIFPRVRERVPDARLRLAGERPPRDLARPSRPGVEVLGFVEDLEREWRGAAVLAVPLVSGGGVRMKVLDALGRATPVVATALAVRGLDLEPGREFVLAERDGEFADALSGLLVDEERRRAVATAGLSWAAQRPWRATAAAYGRLYDAVLAGDLGPGRHT